MADTFDGAFEDGLGAVATGNVITIGADVNAQKKVSLGAHECMTTRGIHKRGVSMVTSKMLGSFREDARTRAEFLRFIETGRR